MAFANREVEATLQSKFAFTPSKPGADHRWFALKLPGLPPIATKFSHAKQDIGDNLWRIIARQLWVTSSYLTGMIVCTNSQADYYKKVKADHLMRGTTTTPSSPKRRAKPKRKK